MHRIFRRRWTVGFTLACLLASTFSASAAPPRPSDSEVSVPYRESFGSLPKLSELWVGDRHLSIEKVSNGFVVRDLDRGRAAVLTLDDLAPFEVAARESRATGESRFHLVSRSPFGAVPALEMRLARSGSGYRGAILADSVGGEEIDFTYSPILPAESTAGGLAVATGGADHFAEEFVIHITVIFTAAAVGVVGCVALALWVDCGSTCLDKCNDCQNGNGNCYMQGYTEGLCGECDCRCECLAGGGIFEEHQDGCH